MKSMQPRDALSVICDPDGHVQSYASSNVDLTAEIQQLTERSNGDIGMLFPTEQ
jgi:hypothetical protein